MLHIINTTKEFQLIEQDFSTALNLLDIHYQHKIQKKRLHNDKTQALVSQILLLYINNQTTNKPLTIKLTENNRPYCAEFDYNISHSGDYVIIASSISRKVGIDIAHVTEQPIEQFIHVFTDLEFTYIGNIPTRFGIIWTLKESYVKNIGCGLGGIDLKDLEFRFDRSDGDFEFGFFANGKRKLVKCFLKGNEQPFEFKVWLYDNHVISLCVSKDKEDEGLVGDQWTLTELFWKDIYKQ
jgi:4'-phosphopantetheinyl transferase